jgi:abhydrolase domain-containing protein 17
MAYMIIFLNREDIIIIGRSIGSGPATKLAANNNPSALILISAYTSIHSLVEHLIGKWAQFLVADRFKNLEYIKKVNCKVLFLHGKKDKLIPYEHS